MIYNDFKDLKLSSLGMGCMRLPCNVKDFDNKSTEEMVNYAFKKGINYFDTAWGYHDGKSETVMGEILKNYPRESFYLADKFPGYDVNNLDKVEEIFEEQLRKCQVEYFDFYLIHNVCELNIDGYLDPKYRIYEYLLEQKKNGRIRHLGFSAHGNMDTMTRFLEAYSEGMEFCQLQINWLDWEFQNAKEKVELVSSYNIPVWVMEPVRGGSLVNLKEPYIKKLNTLRQNVSNAQWAFRFVQTIPQVKLTLSGMSNFQQLKENIEIFETHSPLNPNEFETLLGFGRDMTNKKTLPCTSCKYCTAHCPMELDIPWLIELYNEHIYSEGGFIAPMALDALDGNKLPSACIGCKACEAVCPQNIKISEMMTDFSEKLK